MDGVGGAVSVGVGGADRFLRTDWRGGDGGRVDEEWRPLVKSRDMEAVALEVPETGATVGGASREGRGTGRGELLLLLGDVADCGCLPRMVRSDSSVRSTCSVSDEDEDDEADSSSMGGVMGRGAWGGVVVRMGVSDRDRKEGEVVAAGGDFDCLTRRTVFELELVLELLPLRVMIEKRGDEDTEPDGPAAGGDTT